MAVALERATRCVMSLSQSRESGRPPDEASGNTGGQADSKPPEAGSARHDLHAPWNATVERPVIPAWKRQRNTGDLRRNATSWLARPRPSGIVRSWRKWRRPGRGSPRRPTDKALTPRSERVLPWRVRASPALPGGAIPAPYATRLPALSGHGARSPSPSTRRRSVDTRRIAPSGPLR
jgi:hypothetical protein